MTLNDGCLCISLNASNMLDDYLLYLASLFDVDAHMVNSLIYLNLLAMLLFCLSALVVLSLQVHSMY